MPEYKNILIFLMLTGLLSEGFGLELKPFIGLSSLPADTASVCDIPSYPDPVYGGGSSSDFSGTGFQKGDTVADFTLYSLTGDSFNLNTALESGKPVLLVAGSYSCPIYRDRLDKLNLIYSNYSDLVEIAIVYTIEAHPIIDISPYFGYVNTMAINYDEGVLYRQPATYGERKAVVADMLADLSILPPVFIDGPCNNWWLNYGPAPNNAYLINTSGVVFDKHDWFNKYPDNMQASLDSLLFGISDTTSDLSGNFSFSLDSIDSINGEASDILTVKGTLFNSSSADVLIDIIRLDNDIPDGWLTSLCVDICLDPSEDSTDLFLEPGEYQSFTAYFYTNELPSSGKMLIQFSNLNDPSNTVEQYFYANTFIASSIGELIDQELSIYPNPARSLFSVMLPGTISADRIEVLLFSIDGKTIYAPEIVISNRGKFVLQLDPEVVSGQFILQLKADNRIFANKLIVLSR